MTRSTTRRIAALGLAAVAVTAIGGTVSSAGDSATSRQIVSGRYQHTWHPDNAIDGRHQHTWHPDNAIDGRHQHTWHPDNAIDGRHQHTWHPAGDRSDAFAPPARTIP